MGFGLKRLTGDIDILEPSPKNEAFYRSVGEVLESNGLDPKTINDGAKGFVDDLSPNYRQRVVPLNAGFKKLDVSIIGKADFLTMKICAWRESDMEDVRCVGISKEDLSIISENLSYLSRHSPDRAYRAQMVLSEIGFESSQKKLQAEDVNSLSELIQYYRENVGRDAPLEDIRTWKDKILSGSLPSHLASQIANDTDDRSVGMDV